MLQAALRTPPTTYTEEYVTQMSIGHLDAKRRVLASLWVL